MDHVDTGQCGVNAIDDFKRCDEFGSFVAVFENVEKPWPNVDVEFAGVGGNDACRRIDFGSDEANDRISISESAGEIDELLVGLFYTIIVDWSR